MRDTRKSQRVPRNLDIDVSFLEHGDGILVQTDFQCSIYERQGFRKLIE